MRIGHGYDVHKLVPNRKCIIGGVTIPHETGLLGHSDADVLLHAIMDALLGACALGDIGHLFPDNDPKFEGADSLTLLKEVGKHLSDHGSAIWTQRLWRRHLSSPPIFRTCAKTSQMPSVFRFAKSASRQPQRKDLASPEADRASPHMRSVWCFQRHNSVLFCCQDAHIVV